jgi:arylsulfatase A-like enzyme
MRSLLNTFCFATSASAATPGGALRLAPQIMRLLRPLLLLGACAAPLATAATPPAKPNLVFILADDLGYGDVQALNPARGKIPTPHLDRLAAQGLAFTDAHSGASVCTPTRYGLLTGRYAWRTRLQRGVLDGGSAEPLIAADRLTLPALLRGQGYATACIGKWHLGFLSDEAPPPPAPSAAPAMPARRSAPASWAGRSPAGSTISGAAPTPAPWRR